MITHLLLPYAAVVAMAFSSTSTAQKEMTGEYQYSFPETGQNQGAITDERIFSLSFDSGFVYYEDHENFQCFANLNDYGGHYRISHDTLFCQRKGLTMNNYDRKERYFIPVKLDGIRYDSVLVFRITPDTLFSLDNPAIKLAKNPKTFYFQHKND